MNSKTTRKVIRELAEKYKLNFDQAFKIAESQFLFVADRMKAGDKETLTFFNVRLKKWGMFGVKPGRKNFFKRLYEKRKETDLQDQD